MDDVGSGIDGMGDGVVDLGRSVVGGVSYAGRKTWGGVCFLSGKAWNAATSTGSFIREHSPFYSIPKRGLTPSIVRSTPNNSHIFGSGNAKGAVVLKEAVDAMRQLRSATQKTCAVALIGLAFTALMVYLAVQQKSSLAITFAVLAGIATMGGTGYFLYERHQHNKTLYGDKDVKGLLNHDNLGEQLAQIYRSLLPAVDIEENTKAARHQKLLEIKAAFDKQYKKELDSDNASFKNAETALENLIQAYAPQQGN